MRILRNILIVIAILIAIPLIFALFIKKDYAIEREVVINRPKDQVFGYIKMLRNQDNYSKWATMEPHMKKEYRGTDGTVGFVSAWEGKEVGKGEQEIRQISEGQKIDYNLHFKKPFESTMQSYMSTEATGETKTKVKWGLVGSSPYPMNIMNVFMNRGLGRDLQTGLDNLRALLERQ